MISGAHVVIYSKDPEADRAFFRDVLGLPFADAGHGWLIFGLPSSEAAFHPAGENGKHEFYFICEDLKAEIAAFRQRGVACSEPHEERWGTITTISLPGGGQLGLYQPKHPRP